MKTHRFTLEVKTLKSRKAAELDVLCAFAARDPDDCRFKLHKSPPRAEPERTAVTCVYCGHEYPDGTPTAKAEALTEHVKVCDKHPMKRVRAALAALVGADTREELQAMRDAMFAVTMPAKERADMVDAIDALIDTLPQPEQPTP